jgi:hypothetical protein
MPFGGWFDGYYSAIYQPAIVAAGLTPKRADDMYRPSTIVNDIWDYTKQAKIILADLTGKNANVFYELGLAHALAKPAILVAETMNDVPFDLRALRVIEYDKNEPNWGDLLKDKITKSISEVLASPLAAVLPAFLDVKPADQQPKVSERDIKMIELRQEVDLLRRELRSRLERDRGPMIQDADEAESLLRRFLDARMPRHVIVREMAERGAPPGWVEMRLDQLSQVAYMQQPIPGSTPSNDAATPEKERRKNIVAARK